MKIYTTLLSIIIVYYVIVFFLLSSTGYARNLGEEREMADPDATSTDGDGGDSSVSASPSGGGGGGETPEGFGLFTFIAGDDTFYVQNDKAVSYKSDIIFKSYKVTLSGTAEKVIYTLKADFYCDATKDNGDKCTTSEGQCKEVSFTIKKDGSTLSFDGDAPDGYTSGLRPVNSGDNDYQHATTALNNYSNESTCKVVNNILPTNVQIKFSIENKGEVHVLGNTAVRKSGNEYTYYTVLREESNMKESVLTFTSLKQCSGKEVLPQSYYTCNSEVVSQSCEGITKVTIKYTSDSDIVFISPPNGYTGLSKDSEFSIGSYADKTQCKVSFVEDDVSIKFNWNIENNDYTLIITKEDAIQYKNGDKMDYVYSTAIKSDDGVYGGSKYKLGAGYSCKDSTVGNIVDGATVEVNYYKAEGDSTEHFKIVSPEELSSADVEVASESDVKLVEQRKDQSFCKSSGGDDGNSYPQPLGDKVVKSKPIDKDDENKVYRILDKDRHYIVKENTYQYSTKLTRNTVDNNNFTTITVTEDNLNVDNIYKTETGFFKNYFIDSIQNDFGCPEPKSFASIAWCNKNCGNATGVLEKLKSDIGDYIEEGVSLNLTLKNGTNEVYEFKSESNPFDKLFGNITDFTAEMEDIGFSVIPTILFSIFLIFLL